MVREGSIEELLVTGSPSNPSGGQGRVPRKIMHSRVDVLSLHLRGMH